jgi:hypothetical protein
MFQVTVKITYELLSDKAAAGREKDDDRSSQP